MSQPIPIFNGKVFKQDVNSSTESSNEQQPLNTPGLIAQL
jgi:hypothetical protein